jgi:hypothetical protein
MKRLAAAAHRTRAVGPLSRTVGPVGLALAMLAACATSSEPYVVHVRNDLQQTVTLAVCDSHDCSKTVDPWVLKPGQTGAVNVEINGGYGPAILFSSAHSVIGCLPFRLSRRPSASLVVVASDAVACGSSGGVDSARGKDWP